MRNLWSILGMLALLVVTIGTASAEDGIIERSYYLSNSFNVLAYNIYMRPTSMFFNDQSDRGRLLPSKLLGFDVIVFSEAFDDPVRNRLIADLRHEYPYSTSILGSDHETQQDGGVIILSRWPITAQDQYLFGNVCSGIFDDCLAQKGVLYARIEKYGRTYHVFGSHTQAENSTERQQTRQRQFGIIKAFIDSMRLPDTEPVFIAGDLNVNKYDAREYTAMLRTLDAWQPRQFGHPYSFDPTINRRARGRREYLDYVLVSNRHLQPTTAIIETLLLRSPKRFGLPIDVDNDVLRGNYDLSDHFPVFGHFMFPSPAAVIAATGG